MNTDETRIGQMVDGETLPYHWRRIRGSCALGYGFLEVYQGNAGWLSSGSQAELRSPSKFIRVRWSENISPLLVDGSVMVEIKVAKRYNPEDKLC
jgi:hypothetical protein